MFYRHEAGSDNIFITIIILLLVLYPEIYQIYEQVYDSRCLYLCRNFV